MKCVTDRASGSSSGLLGLVGQIFELMVAAGAWGDGGPDRRSRWIEATAGLRRSRCTSAADTFAATAFTLTRWRTLVPPCDGDVSR